MEAEDVAVLYIVGLAIETGGLLRSHEPDRGLATLSDVPSSLGRLQRNGLIEFTREEGGCRVEWGKRALDIARKAGVARD